MAAPGAAPGEGPSGPSIAVTAALSSSLTRATPSALLLASDWQPAPLPCWAAGSWPDSQSGGGTGLGGGGHDVCGCAFCAGGGGCWSRDPRFQSRPLAGRLAGIAAACLVRHQLMAATLAALEARCTPSPAQMLIPSTVVISCREDSDEPKKPRIFIALASPLQRPQ